MNCGNFLFRNGHQVVAGDDEVEIELADQTHAMGACRVVDAGEGFVEQGLVDPIHRLMESRAPTGRDGAAAPNAKLALDRRARVTQLWPSTRRQNGIVRNAARGRA